MPNHLIQEQLYYDAILRCASLNNSLLRKHVCKIGTKNLEFFCELFEHVYSIDLSVKKLFYKSHIGNLSHFHEEQECASLNRSYMCKKICKFGIQNV